MGWADIDRQIRDRIGDAFEEAVQDAPYIVELEAPVKYGNLGGSNPGTKPGYRPEWQPQFEADDNSMRVTYKAPYAERQNTDPDYGNAGFVERTAARLEDNVRAHLRKEFE